MYLKLLGRSLFLELEPARSKRSPRFDRWTSGGETFIRFGRLSLIYTPPDWRARRDREAKALAGAK